MPSTARETAITRSITRTILDDDGHSRSSKHQNDTLITRIVGQTISAFLRIYELLFVKYAATQFTKLRRDTWGISELEYRDTFRNQNSNHDNPTTVLDSLGDMGYSGSTFFVTHNSKCLVKSIPRRFEHSFFRDEMLEPYIEHMSNHPDSLLIHILDFIGSPYPSVGSLLSLAPTHHIVMDNLLVGKGSHEQWDTWDLKPDSYLYPERDIAGGKFTPSSVQDRLVDKFEDHLRLDRTQAEAFWTQLEQDTMLLQNCNAVDYSLFLVRIPLEETEQDGKFATSGGSWRTGVKTVDDKYVFRAAILDFFWAKHTVHAQGMTILINAWNLVDRQAGPMSITTTPDEYRSRFLKMCREIVHVQSKNPSH